MTGDARGEAERIVQRIVGDRLTVDLQYDALVAALAAAIEVQWSMHNDCDGWDWRLEALDGALSALRARAGEET